jgi:cation diffusion facilitator family transporter
MGTNGTSSAAHNHVFLGVGHDKNERRTWAVIALCTAMMVAEIVGGFLFGSIALVADGLHMSTHASALLLAALAYNYARRHADDPRFSFGTGKLGDLAGFSSAIVLAMIALLIGYEAISRLFAPVPISFNEAIPIAVLGLIVNVASVLLLSGGGHDHSRGHHHNHGHGHGADDHNHDAIQRIDIGDRALALEIFEHGVPPRFRLAAEGGAATAPKHATIETVRPGGARQVFVMADRGGFLESIEEIPEPHAFTVEVRLDHGAAYSCVFTEHEHADATAHRDNNMRAAVVHVLADAVVSGLVIVGLVLARAFGWLFMDPVVGIFGAFVIAAWSYGLIRDTGAILLDMNPDRGMAERLRATIERDGDRLKDLHLWRLGPGHLGAILSIVTAEPRDAEHYRRLLGHFRNLSHVTVEVQRG